MWTIFQFEVKYYFKNLQEAIQSIALFLSIVILYPFTRRGLEIEYQTLAESILWIALIMGLMASAQSLFQRDRDSGRLEYYQLSKIPLERVILGKWCAYYLSAMFPLLISLPVAELLLGIAPEAWLHHATGLIVGALPLSIITALVSLVVSNTEKAGVVLSLTLLPLVIPIIIFGSSYIEATGELAHVSLIFLLGFSVVLLPILCMAGGSCIKASH